MTNATPPSGRIDYVAEGFSVHWDRDGLEIHVTEYHPKPLRLPWDVLLELSRKAGRGARAPDA
jgi:hypothetical protein